MESNRYLSRLLRVLSFCFPKWDPSMVVLAGEQLVNIYTYYGGAYHNLDHIKSCLKELDSYPFIDPDKQASVKLLELALWYHDIVCIPGRNDNEERSCNWFHAYTLTTEPKSDCVDLVMRMIRATKHNVFPNASHMEELIVDIDLSILGQPPEIYDVMQQRSRKSIAPEIQ